MDPSRALELSSQSRLTKLPTKSDTICLIEQRFFTSTLPNAFSRFLTLHHAFSCSHSHFYASSPFLTLPHFFSSFLNPNASSRHNRNLDYGGKRSSSCQPSHLFFSLQIWRQEGSIQQAPRNARHSLLTVSQSSVTKNRLEIA